MVGGDADVEAEVEFVASDEEGFFDVFLDDGVGVVGELAQFLKRDFK